MVFLTSAYNWIKGHPKLLVLLLIVLAFLGGYGSAYFGHPAKIVEHTQIKTVTETKIQYQDRIVTQKVYVEVEKKHEHTETTTTKKPDGTTETHTTTDDNIDESQSNNTNTTAQHQETVTQVVTKTVYKDKLVLRQPDWRVFAGVGFAFSTLAGQPEVGLPSMHGLVVQAGADRRILGPVFLGVSLNTQGTGFVNLSGVF